MNQAILIGRISNNIEVRKTSENVSFTSFSLAVQRNVKNKDGIYEADFIKCVLWGNIADIVSQYCNKGDLIAVKGSLQNNKYEYNGQKRIDSYVKVDKVTFLNTKVKEAKVETNEEIQEDPFKDFGQEVDIDKELEDAGIL